MTYPRKPAAGKPASGLAKRASPYARRLAALIRSGKIKAVSRRMLEGLLAKPGKPAGPLDYRGIIRQAKETGRSLSELLHEARAARTVPAYGSEAITLDHMFRNGPWLKADDSILRLIEGPRNQRDVSSAYRELLAPKLKSARHAVDELVDQGVLGREVVLPRQLKGRGNVFRGSAEPVGAEWDITQPGWATGNIDIALGYAHPTLQGVLSVSNVGSSKAFRTGKTFFHGKYAYPKRSVRAYRRAIDEARFGKFTPEDSYEIVFPGHEMRGMPWEHYVPVSGRHGRVEFRKIVDLEKFERLKDKIWNAKRELSDARDTFRKSTQYARESPLETLRTQRYAVDAGVELPYSPFEPEIKPVHVPAPAQTVTETAQAVSPDKPPRTGAFAKLRSILGRLGVKGWTAAGLTAGAAGTGAGLGYHYLSD